MKRSIQFLILLVLGLQWGSAQITSAGSGDWSDEGTWVGSVVPTSTDNVIIASGHTVTVDDNSAQCANISFGATTSKLSFATGGILSVYGNFTIASTSHNCITSWASGAKIKFTGSAATQTLSGWHTGTGSSTSLLEVVVDKASGKVVTNAANMRLTIGTSLVVTNGTFELAAADDMEFRDLSGTATAGTITVQSGATFTLAGGAHHLRSGTLTGEETSKPGKLTVFGTAILGTSSTNRLNFGGIDIENGGVVEMATGKSTASATFNPGVITVKSGGTFKNSLSTTMFWYNNLTIPPSVVVQSGGEYECAATSTTIPQGGITQNSGSTFRYSSGSATVLPAGITSYKNLILSGAGSKTLGVNTTIDESMQLSGSFTSFLLNSFTLTYDAAAILRYGASGQATAQTTTDTEWPASSGPQNVQIYNTGGVTLHDNRTIAGTLTLTLGTFDNNGGSDDKVLSIANGAAISRARGALSAAPSFGTTANLAYTSAVENVTTSFELPASTSVLNNLSVTSSQGVTLGAATTVNGILTFGGSAGSVTTNGNTLTLAATGSMTGEAAGRYVIGTLAASAAVGTGASTLGGIGVSLASGADDLGNVAVTRVSGAGGIVTSGGQSIARKWTITSDNPPTSGRNVTFTWVSSDDNSKSFSGANKAQVLRYNGSSWENVGASVDVSGSDPRTITVSATAFSQWTVTDENTPLPVELVSFTAQPVGSSVLLQWKTASEVNNSGFSVERNTKGTWRAIAYVEGHGTSNAQHSYAYTDAAASGAVQYRLKQIDRDGRGFYSNAVEVFAAMAPEEYSLSQNFPNPFNPTTSFTFAVQTSVVTSVKVYDIIGTEVATLFNGITVPNQKYTITFDASRLTSGSYFYVLRSGQRNEVKRMLLLK